ncbi:MAG: sigma factor [Deltaproteobacteria bacterium]|nr:sigma factor [Deltaproteobacteria bacterium]
MADLDHLLPLIAAGDPDAFGRWVAGVEARLRLSLSSFATTLDTEPIVQETLLRVWQVAPRVVPDGRGESLLRLAVRIARNLAVSELRRQRPAPLDAQDLERILQEAPAEAPPPDPLLRRLIAYCREKLPRQPARALTARLHAAGGESDTTLAGGLGMRTNTFLQNVGRARRLLADCLERQGADLGGVRP